MPRSSSQGPTCAVIFAITSVTVLGRFPAVYGFSTTRPSGGSHQLGHGDVVTPESATAQRDARPASGRHPRATARPRTAGRRVAAARGGRCASGAPREVLLGLPIRRSLPRGACRKGRGVPRECPSIRPAQCSDVARQIRVRAQSNHGSFYFLTRPASSDRLENRKRSEGWSACFSKSGSDLRFSARSADRPQLSPAGRIILDDTAHQERTDWELVYAGMGAGVVRLIGATLFFQRRRRDAVAA